MSKIRKYYWLKLKEAFFSDLKIKKLRKMAGGDTYTIIFQKIMLLSLKDDGYIKFQNIEQNLQKELALILDEDEDNVFVTIGFLIQTNILQKEDDNTFFIPLVSELTGAETEYAKKKREYRQRQKKDNVSLMSDKREDIEIEKRRYKNDIETLAKYSSLTANEISNINIEKLSLEDPTKKLIQEEGLQKVVDYADNHKEYLENEIRKKYE